MVSPLKVSSGQFPFHCSLGVSTRQSLAGVPHPVVDIVATCGKVQGAAQNHYPTMSDEQLYRLPVSTLAADTSVLFLWCTFPKLPEALKLIKAWGFTFKTVAFVWLKQNKSGNGFFLGLGWWTRSNAEICLLAVRGKPKRKSASVRQLVFAPVEQHSKKPDIVRDRILELMGDLPRIELFARQTAPGWDVWGNEVDSSISFP